MLLNTLFLYKAWLIILYVNKNICNIIHSSNLNECHVKSDICNCYLLVYTLPLAVPDHLITHTQLLNFHMVLPAATHRQMTHFALYLSLAIVFQWHLMCTYRFNESRSESVVDVANSFEYTLENIKNKGWGKCNKWNVLLHIFAEIVVNSPFPLKRLLSPSLSSRAS